MPRRPSQQRRHCERLEGASAREVDAAATARAPHLCHPLPATRAAQAAAIAAEHASDLLSVGVGDATASAAEVSDVPPPVPSTRGNCRPRRPKPPPTQCRVEAVHCAVLLLPADGVPRDDDRKSYRRLRRRAAAGVARRPPTAVPSTAVRNKSRSCPLRVISTRKKNQVCVNTLARGAKGSNIWEHPCQHAARSDTERSIPIPQLMSTRLHLGTREFITLAPLAATHRDRGWYGRARRLAGAFYTFSTSK